MPRRNGKNRKRRARERAGGGLASATATAALPTSRLPDYGDEAGDIEAHLDVSIYRAVKSDEAVASHDAEFAWPIGEPRGRAARDVAQHAGLARGVAAERDVREHPRAETDAAMRGLFGRDALYLLVGASQSGLAALSIPVMTRLLGKGYGVVATSIAVMQLLLSIGLLCLHTAVQRNYRAADHGRDARRTVSLAVISSGIFLIAEFATGSLWAPALSLGNFGRAVQYAVIWAALTAVTWAGLALIRSRNLLRVYALISVIQSFVATLFGVLLVVFVQRTAAEFIFGEMLMQVVAAAIAMAVVRPIMLRRRDLDLARRSLKYSLPLVPAAVSTFLLTTSDRIVIRADLPLLQLARYGAVYNVASIPLLLLGLLDQAWLPRFFAIEDARLRRTLLAESRDALYRILIPVALAFGFGIPLLLAVWVPHDYDAAGLVIVVLTISVGAFPLANFISTNRVLLISGRTIFTALCMAVTAVFNIVANIALVPVLGIEGSALSTLLAFVLLALLSAAAARRIEHLGPPSVKVLAMSAAAVGVALLSTLAPWAVSSRGRARCSLSPVSPPSS